MTNREDEIAELKRRLAALEGEASEAPAPPPPDPPASSAPPSSRKTATTGMSTPLVLTAVIAAVVVAVIAWGSRDTATSPAANGAHQYDSEIQRQIAEEVSSKPAPDPNSSAWAYRDDADPMTDELTRWACTTSTNRAYLDSPYEPVTARLCLRQSPRHGLDVIVALNGSGQIICRSYRDCTVKVRFDDGSAQSFSAADSADGSSNVVFIPNATRFIAAAKGAKTTQIELLFYQAGNQSLSFPTANLVWPRPSTTP